MTRAAALLIALLLVLAAVPARAQQSAATPLPALLQPARYAAQPADLRAAAIGPIARSTLTGMGIGCVITGALTAAISAETAGQHVSNGILGCFFGSIAGGTFGLTFGIARELVRPR